MVAANARWYYSPAYWGLMVNIYSLYCALTYKISQNLSSPRFFFIPRTTGKHRFLTELNVLSAFTAIFRECTIYWRFVAIHREAFFTGGAPSHNSYSECRKFITDSIDRTLPCRTSSQSLYNSKFRLRL